MGEYRAAAHSICNWKFSVPNHFIIKELSEECEGEFTCLGENTE